jgi:hypothetical protein
LNFNERLPRVKEHFRVELLTGRRKESILVQMRTRKVVPIEQRIRGILRSPEGRRITLWSISLLTVFGILFVMEFACAMYLATLAPADSVGKFRRSRPPPVRNYDFSNILNDRPPGVEYFLDAYHVNHEANQVIADKILDVLREIIASRDVSGQTPMSKSKP